MLIGQGAIFRDKGDIIILELDPTARFKIAGIRISSGIQPLTLLPTDIPENVLHQPRPVCNRTSHIPTKYKIIFISVDPGAFNIIDLEFDIGWDPIIKLINDIAFL